MQRSQMRKQKRRYSRSAVTCTSHDDAFARLADGRNDERRRLLEAVERTLFDR